MNHSKNRSIICSSLFGAAVSVLVALSGGTSSAEAAATRTAFEDPSVIKVIDGLVCARSTCPGTAGKGGPKGCVGSAYESVELPEYADRATVVMNGVQARYEKGDHHLTRIRATLDDIHIDDGRILWRHDLSFVEDSGTPRTICYRFAAVAWNSDVIDAERVDRDEYLDLKDASQDVDTREVASGNLREGENVAIVPGGFELEYKRRRRRPRNRDRHVYQIAYDLGQDRGFGVEGEIRWQAQGILKDKRNRKQKFRSVASVLVGKSVGVIPSDFEIKRRASCRGLIKNCIGPGETHHGTRRQSFVRNVRDHDYVVPMLTGFNLAYPMSDQHVQQVGAWLTQIDFDQTTGRLTYSVYTSLHDKDEKPGFVSSHGVTLLTFDRVDDDVVETQPSVSSTWEVQYDRPGRDYRDFNLPVANPRLCMDACIDDAKCSAWTYVKPGVQGPQARCWLKNSIPAPRLNGNTTSGVVFTVEPNVDRPGGDYRSFDLGRRDMPNECRVECIKDNRCRAWTYVEAGVQGDKPRCWLKDRAPNARPNSKTTSGLVG